MISSRCILLILFPAEVYLYFDLIWKLQWYVNKEPKIIYPVKAPADYEEVDMEDKAKVREYLFDNYQTVAKSFSK